MTTWNVKLGMRLTEKRYGYIQIPYEPNKDDYPSLDFEFLRDSIEFAKAQFPDRKSTYLVISPVSEESSEDFGNGNFVTFVEYHETGKTIRLQLNLEQPFGELVLKITQALNVTPDERVEVRKLKRDAYKAKKKEAENDATLDTVRTRRNPGTEHSYNAKIRQFMSEVAELREANPDESKWNADVKREIEGREIYIQTYRKQLERINRV